MIDLHTHILPGLDDGAGTLEDSLEIARAALADGVRILAATPHVRDDFPTSPEAMEGRLAALREALREASVPLDVRGGGEIALDRLGSLAPDELARFGLGGNPSYLLVEFPYFGFPLALQAQVLELGRNGVTAVVAHPERNADVQQEVETLRPVVEAGALVQVTAASIDGRLGRSCRKAGLDLIECGLAHMIASDAHRADVREIGMSAAAGAIGDEGLARWLTHDVPAAVVERRPIPPRPVSSRRRSFWRR